LLSSGAANFWGKWPPKFLTAFYKSGSPSTMWQSLVTTDQATSQIRRRKKKKERKKIETSAAKQNGWLPAIAGGQA